MRSIDLDSYYGDFTIPPLVINLPINKRKGVEMWVVFLLILSCLGLSYVLPESYGWENGCIETTQVVLLILGMLAGIYMAVKSPRGSKGFGIAASGVYVFLIARELSWGRTLFVKGYDVNGPIITPMKELPFHHIIEAGIVVYVTLVVIGVMVLPPWKKLLRIPVPLVPFILIGIAFVFERIGEYAPGCFYDERGQAQVMEELMEMFAYYLTIRVVWYYGIRLQSELLTDQSSKL